MIRKQRRGAHPPRPSEPGCEALFAAATRHHHAGRLAEAEALYRQLLAAEPRHADSLHRLGVIGYQLCQFDISVEFLRRALAVDPTPAAYHSHLSLALAGLDRLQEAAAAGAEAVRLAPDAAEGHVNLGLVLMRLGRSETASGCFYRAAALAPELPDAHNNLGAALQALGRPAEAADCYRRALELEPQYAEAHTGLGSVLLELGQAQEALAHHQRALQLRPDYVDAHNNLGRALLDLGRLSEAAGCFEAAIRIEPGSVEAHNSLAGIFKAWGRLPEAEASLRQALGAHPRHAGVLENLAAILLAQGRPAEATQAVLAALEISETPHARSAFVRCVSSLQLAAGFDVLRPMLVRALRESWGRPESLARAGMEVICQDPEIAASVGRANAAWPSPVSEAELYGERGFAIVADDELLQLLLCSAPNVDIEFERFLTLARGVLLKAAEKDEAVLTGAASVFYGALARQCFLNEYVFALSHDEEMRAGALRDRLGAALAGGADVGAVQVLAAASYSPLSALDRAERLLERRWPAAVEAVLKQQILEVRDEAALQAEIPRLTAIRDGASLRVQAQYQDAPYPRWTDAGVGEPPQRLHDHLRSAFPLSAVRPIGAGQALDILVAGCGTGRNALDTARAFVGARTLAIDLSAQSLAHALRKTREVGVEALAYAQADLLEIEHLGRSFDLIEAIGVLHHLADPLAGWRALLSVLRPGGVMKLGLYSAVARRNLPRAVLEEASRESVREARQGLLERGGEAAAAVFRAQDFYTLSGCRDLLFHVQESRFSLDEIDAFLREAGLRFLGFVLADAVVAAYQRRFPHDVGAVDLGCWQVFEAENPTTFAEMYQFWVQRI